jgi:hypothetical protein
MAILLGKLILKLSTKMIVQFRLTCDRDEKDPLSYDGPVMYRSIGCKIDWNEGMDVTFKLVKKKQKHKNSGTIRVVTKKEKQDSFFNYFESPTPDGKSLGLFLILVHSETV